MRRISVKSEHIRYVLIGMIMTGGNVLALFTLVSIMEISPGVANLTRTIASNQVRFYANRRFLSAPNQSRLPLWVQWRRHHMLKLGTMTVSQCLFCALVAARTPYMVAYLICCGTIGLLNMTGTFLYVFKRPKPKSA